MGKIKIPKLCKKCKWLENNECHHEGNNYGHDFIGARDDTACFEPK